MKIINNPCACLLFIYYFSISFHYLEFFLLPLLRRVWRRFCCLSSSAFARFIFCNIASIAPNDDDDDDDEDADADADAADVDDLRGDLNDDDDDDMGDGAL